ncbi:cation diffusion facilitator family transporter [Bacillaceae bacterium]
MKPLHQDDNRTVQRGAWVSIIVYAALALGKTGIGFFAGSKALIADGLNNATDIIVALAILIGLKISSRPPDDDHPYGHKRSEGIATLVAAFIMATAGIEVIFDALSAVIRSDAQTPNILSAWTALFAAAVMYLVYRYNSRLAQRTQNQSLKAAAKDNLSDSWVSLGAAAGIFGAQLDLPWLDPLAAATVGILICKTSWGIFAEAAYQLTDGFQKSELNEFRKTIQSVDGVLHVKDIKARTYGNHIIADIVIKVNPELDVVDSHKITEEIERLMQHKHGVAHTHVHVEPVSDVKTRKYSRRQ